MRSRRHREDTDLELAPPAELLALRDALVVPPAAEARAQHVTAAATASRVPVTAVPVGRFAARFASRGAKAAAAIVAGLAITTGLAGAQLLPQPAQRLLSNVSERFAPDSPDSPPATAVDVPDEESSTRSGPGRTDDDERRPGPATTSTSTPEVVADPTPTTDSPPDPTTTTIPGPSGPGSPTDPNDPGTTTTTTVDPTTTTTTTPPTTTTTAPTTTTTTEAPSP